MYIWVFTVWQSVLVQCITQYKTTSVSTATKMPEVDRPDNVMYEVVFEEAKRSKKAKQMQAASVCNLTDIQKKLQVEISCIS